MTKPETQSPEEMVATIRFLRQQLEGVKKQTIKMPNSWKLQELANRMNENRLKYEAFAIERQAEIWTKEK